MYKRLLFYCSNFLNQQKGKKNNGYIGKRSGTLCHIQTNNHITTYIFKICVQIP